MTVFRRLAALWNLPAQLEALETRMASREEASRAQLTATIEQVKTAFTSLQTERDQYKAALESADTDKANAVADALAQDSEHDADAIDAVNSALSELLPGQPAEVPSENGSTDDDGDFAETEEV